MDQLSINRIHGPAGTLHTFVLLISSVKRCRCTFRRPVSLLGSSFLSNVLLLFSWSTDRICWTVSRLGLKSHINKRNRLPSSLKSNQSFECEIKVRTRLPLQCFSRGSFLCRCLCGSPSFFYTNITLRFKCHLCLYASYSMCGSMCVDVLNCFAPLLFVARVTL